MCIRRSAKCAFAIRRTVRDAVVAAVRRTLESDRESWQEQFRAAAGGGRAVFPSANPEVGTTQHVVPPVTVTPNDDEADAFAGGNSAAAGGRWPGLCLTSSRSQRVETSSVSLGVLNKLYVLMENVRWARARRSARSA